MSSLRQALDFFYTHFFALTLAFVLLGAPEFLLAGYFIETYPGLLTGKEPILAVVAVLLLALLAPFRQAGFAVVMNAKRLGQTVTVQKTLQAGLQYWRPLLVLNLVRVFLTVFLVIVASFVSRMAQTPEQQHTLMLAVVFFGTLYIIVRLAYFDALIVLEQRTALEALTLSTERTATNGSLLLSVVGVTLGFLFLENIALKLPDPMIAAILSKSVLPMLLLCLVQIVCFTFFWNTRPIDAETQEK